MPPRVTYTTAVVLQAIAHGYRYGFDIMEATGLPSGTVYPALRRLEHDGQLSSRWEREDEAQRAQRPPRRYYAISKGGEHLLADARARFHGLDRVLAPAEESRRELSVE